MLSQQDFHSQKPWSLTETKEKKGATEEGMNKKKRTRPWDEGGTLHPP